MTLGRLAAVFVVLSLLGFGGGNAIIPQMHADVVERFHWITSPQFTRFFAVAKLAPGPTTTMAALVGFAVKGFLGAVVATIAVFAPAAIVTYVGGRLWDRFEGHAWRDRFAGAIKPVVLGLIWAGVLTLARGAVDSVTTVAFALVATIVLLVSDWNQSILVLAAGVAGAVLLR
ncbi:MAG: chromate transporter [Candidatus Eremiobacteraeota bacterium]|nr:chromate transporter [Candidatus Eremiobacteraeota bacterium]